MLGAVRPHGDVPFDTSLLPMIAVFADQAALALKLVEDQRQINALRSDQRSRPDRARPARSRDPAAVRPRPGVAEHTDAQPRIDVQQRLSNLVDEAQVIIYDVRTAISDLHGRLPGMSTLRRDLHDIIDDATADTMRAVVRMSGPLDVVAGELADHAQAVTREDTMACSGLHNLARRADDAGGEMSVTRRDSGGIRLVWSAPLPRSGTRDPENSR